MSIEIEKKYRLTPEAKGALRERLGEAGELAGAEEFEENTLYAGHGLDAQSRVLRLRRAGGRALLTYKEKDRTESAVKRQREEETEVADAEALAAILEALGYRPALVYEKRRETWRAAGAEVVLDELPFGLFVEIEGEEAAILAAERLLGLTDATVEHASYPELTARLGAERDGVREARFDREL
jgi:adenylate cyclase class 2